MDAQKIWPALFILEQDAEGQERLDVSKPKSNRKDYTYVAIQILLFIGYLLPQELHRFDLPSWMVFSGLLITALGVVLGVTAMLQLNTKLSPFPTPAADVELITSGAFSFCRHPIYTAILLVAFGLAVFYGSTYKCLMSLLFLVLFFFKSRYEERLMMENFPAYRDYMKRTPRFFPGF